MIDPLLRRTPGFVRRAPGWTIAVALAAAALALASATPPLVADAAADRSFTAEADAAAGAPPGQALDARAVTTGLVDAKGVDAVRQMLDELPVYNAAIASVWPLRPYSDPSGPVPVIRAANGEQATAIVYARDGAIASIDTSANGTSTDNGEGLWIPDTVADALGLQAGDSVTVALDRPGADPATLPPAVPTVVAGVYGTTDGLPSGDDIDWADVPGGVPRNPLDDAEPAHLLIADTATALDLIAKMADVSFVTWDLPWAAPIDLQHGRDAADAVDEADRLLRNIESDIGTVVSDAGGEPVVLHSGVEGFVDRSERAAAELQPLVASIALTGRVMSALVLAVGAWLLTRNRRREHQLSMSMGLHPLRLALTTVLELAFALVGGVAIAWVVVRWQPQLVAGRGTVDTRTIRTAVTAVLRSLPVAAVTVAAAAFAAVWPLEPSSAGRARRVAGALHADTVVIVAAVATGAQLVTQRGRTLDSGTSLLFPMFAQLAGAMIVVRLAGWIGRGVSARRARRGPHRRTRRPRSLAAWLAARRAMSWMGELSALVVVVAAGVGLFVYSTSVAVNGERGVSDKAAAVGGARATVPVASTAKMTIGDRGLPVGLAQGWSVLWAVTSLHVGPDLVSDLLIVDPDTFADAADWRSSFAETSLDSLLRTIDEGNAATIPVVLAGNYNDTFPDTGVMELDRAFAHYEVVARVAAAPWIRERSSMMIMSAPRLFQVLPVNPNLDPPLTVAGELDRRFRTYVWADQPAADVVPLLGPVVLDDETIDTVVAARTPEFVAFGMSLPYLRIVGIGLLAVALVSIVVLGARRRADLAMEIAMTDRMGIRRRTTTLAVAGGAVLLGLIGSAIGIGIAAALVQFMLHRLDPGPEFAPGFTGGLSGESVAVAVGAVVVVSVLGAFLEVRGARRARVVEVLRAAE